MGFYEHIKINPIFSNVKFFLYKSYIFVVELILLNEKRFHMRMVLGLISFIFLLVQPSLSFMSPVVEADPDTIYVKSDYLTIQDAIENADEGDNIIVESGTYKEAARSTI